MVTASLTLSTALDLYHAHTVSRGTVEKLRCQIRCWQRRMGLMEIHRITEQHFDRFRRRATDRRLAAFTIETTISGVRAILNSCRHAGVLDTVPGRGKRLRVKRGAPQVPELEALGAVYAVCVNPKYPGGKFCRVTLSQEESAHVLRTFLVAGYILGLRLGDLLGLEWQQVGTRAITLEARKTGKQQRIPLHPVLSRHLNDMPRLGPRVFEPIQWSARHRLRTELKSLCDVAGVPALEPKKIRRLAGTEYERAHGGAGRLLLGHGWPTQATAFYIDESVVLEEASRKLRLPDEWLTPEERDRSAVDKSQINARYDAMTPESREALKRVALSLP